MNQWTQVMFIVQSMVVLSIARIHKCLSTEYTQLIPEQQQQHPVYIGLPVVPQSGTKTANSTNSSTVFFSFSVVSLLYVCMCALYAYMHSHHTHTYNIPLLKSVKSDFFHLPLCMFTLLRMLSLSVAVAVDFSLFMRSGSQWRVCKCVRHTALTPSRSSLSSFFIRISGTCVYMYAKASKQY